MSLSLCREVYFMCLNQKSHLNRLWIDPSHPEVFVLKCVKAGVWGGVWGLVVATLGALSQALTTLRFGAGFLTGLKLTK